MKRRDFLFRTSTALTAALTGCGGSSEATSAAGTPPPGPSPSPLPNPGPPSSPWIPSGPGLPSLTLHPTLSGTFPYLATAYPLEGAVPNGQVIESPEDPLLRSSVLSRWPDGSAQVVALAGETTVTSATPKAVSLRAGNARGSSLDPSRVAQLLTSISVNFGAGQQTLSSFTTPERIWWANERVICCRYRFACGLGVMEAVVDVHAFSSNRAFVEVVIENGKVDANLTTVVRPATQTYTGATVAVNGSTIATVSSPTAGMTAPNSRGTGTPPLYVGGHTAFRAWYCNGWVGGDPAMDVTHDPESMMGHPWFFRRAVPSAQNLQTRYEGGFNVYVPWAFCRLRFPSVNGGGADEEIGLVTHTQADYLLSGNKYARRAAIDTGLAPLSAAMTYRHTDGSVPTRAQVVGKNTSAGTWPTVPEPASQSPRWGGDASYTDGSHVPNISLVPFLCRPSPVFIELAQNEFLFHHTNYNSTDGSHAYDQDRSRGWRARNMATTIFLTPDVDSARKDGYRTALVNQINVSRNFMNQPWNQYQSMYGPTISAPGDNNSTRPRFQTATYMHCLVAMCWHSIANAKVLRGTDQTIMEAAADQVMNFPLRWFSDAPSYEWRAIPYQTTLGILSGSQINAQFGNAIQEHFYNVTGTPPNAPGPWLNFGTDLYEWSGAQPQLVANTGTFYPEHTWFVLCCAVERGVAGAEAAWTKVYGTSGNGGITNFSTWLAGLGNDRAYLNRFPRNK